jgi:hypothetical protein
VHLHRLLAVTSLTLLVAASGSASAAASPTAPGLAVNPTGGTPLTTIKIIGQGFCKPGPTCGPVSITIAYVEVDSSHLTWTSGGSFVGFVRVPGSARPGADAVVAQQAVNGNQVMARTTFNVSTGVPAPTIYTTPPSVQPPGGFPATTVTRSSATTTPSATTRGSNSGPSTSTGAAPTSTSTARATTTTTTAGNAVAANVPGRHAGTSNTAPWIILALALGAAAAVGGWIAVRRRRRREENLAQ